MSDSTPNAVQLLDSAIDRVDTIDMRSIWASASSALGADIDQLYKALDAASRSTRGTEDGLKQSQRAHWDQLMAAGFERDATASSGDAINRHVDAGVSVDTYVAAYGWLILRAIPKISAAYRFNAKARDRALIGLIRSLFADLAAGLESVDANRTSSSIEETEREMHISSLGTLSWTVSDVNEVAVDMAFLARNTDGVAESAQTIASAAAELVASVEEIARNSEGAASDATESDRTVNNGAQAMDSVARAVTNISDAVDETSASVDQLVEASDQIGQILSVIENIAEQTNLLALNATIEAARAGEAGRGFAVVASEVKSLAGQTSRSTEDIAGRIEQLRHGMSVITDTMQHSKTAVDEGKTAIEAATATMSEIAEQVRGVSAKMGDVANVLSQQKDVTSEVARNVDWVAETAGENRNLLSHMTKTLHDANARYGDTAKKWFKAGSHRALCEMAKIDHVLFKKRLVDALSGSGEWNVGDVPDHHNCRLGKWYDSLNVPEIRDLPAYAALIGPHERVHATAREALTAHGRNDVDGAMEALRRHNEASNEVLTLLGEISASLNDDLAHIDAPEARSVQPLGAA